MEDNVYIRRVITTLIFATLIVLSFFLLKPILLSILFGFILAFMFSPLYNWIFKLTKLKNFPAIIICAILLLGIIVPLWFFTPIIIDESIKLFVASQQLDVVTPIKNIFPSLFASEAFSQQASLTINNFITKLTSSLMTYLSDILLNFPVILLNIFVIFFTLFYTLKEKKEMVEYLRGILPFSKEIEKRLFESTRDITFSVLYGYVIIGLIQGTILGIGLFLFQVPNAFVLSIIALIVGILPILGPSLVGVPAAIFLLIGGNSFSAIGILVFTFIASFSDYLIRPILVSKKAKLPMILILIGMIGGFLMFGILGFILGPLIIAYMIIVMELFKNKSAPSVLKSEEK
ncbi:AI-2E family transporter [Candidatus Pacearchaeota archaeon]|jgi:predicted PurR-regulated permease PerM|nr:AI-2E family transporter [Candidatus Pacearchaeota archaeon]